MFELIGIETTYSGVLALVLIWSFLTRTKLQLLPDTVINHSTKMASSFTGMILFMGWALYITFTSSHILLGIVTTSLVPVVWFFGPFLTVILLLVGVVVTVTVLSTIILLPLDYLTRGRYNLHATGKQFAITAVKKFSAYVKKNSQVLEGEEDATADSVQPQ